MVASPHSSRCGPSRIRSPGLVTGCGRRLGHRILVGQPDRRAVLQQVAQLAGIEAGQAEIKARLLQVGEFDHQQRLVPAGVQGDAVVGQHQRAALGVGKPGQRDGRHLGHAELARCQHPAVAGNQRPVLGDQHRVGETELADGAGDLGDLRVRMHARVPGIGHQRVERAVFDEELALGMHKEGV